MKKKNTQENKDIIRKNEELLALNRSLVSQNKELKQFAYLATHDLQQPLNNIISFLSLLEENKNNLDDLGKTSIDVIKKSTYKMKRLINSLLELSLIGNDKHDELISVDEILKNVLEKLSDKILVSNAKVNINVDSHQFKGSKNEIYLLFLNLIENALNFSRKGIHPEIHINSKKETNHYEYSITDNGIGIDEKYFDEIFKIFYTIENKDKSKGVGIGLPQCKKILQLYNCKIWLESTINQGTKVYFTLPNS